MGLWIRSVAARRYLSSAQLLPLVSMRPERPWRGTKRVGRGLRALCLVGAAVVAAAFVSLLAGSAAAAPTTATLHLYVGCSAAASAEPAHGCTLGGQPGAFFESSAEVEYEVCVTFPSTNTLCPEEQVAKAGVLYVNPITTSQLGEHVVHWFVGGSEVASWAFVVEPASVPPPPSPVSPPPAPPPAEVEPAITQACRSDRSRMHRLLAQLRHTAEPGQRRRLRPRLRRAQTTARHACS
jgi:hypothetical protein